MIAAASSSEGAGDIATPEGEGNSFSDTSETVPGATSTQEAG